MYKISFMMIYINILGVLLAGVYIYIYIYIYIYQPVDNLSFEEMIVT